jgi:hypothetical protein
VQVCLLLPQILFVVISGVFDDSLPDGWSSLLLDRYLKSNGIMEQVVENCRNRIRNDKELGIV